MVAASTAGIFNLNSSRKCLVGQFPGLETASCSDLCGWVKVLRKRRDTKAQIASMTKERIMESGEWIPIA